MNLEEMNLMFEELEVAEEMVVASEPSFGGSSIIRQILQLIILH